MTMEETISESVGALSDSSEETGSIQVSTPTQNPGLTAADVSRIVNAAISQRLKASQPTSPAQESPKQAPQELELTMRLKAMEDKLAQAESKERNSRLQVQLSQSLSAYGITGAKEQKAAIAMLKADSLVDFNGDEPVFISENGALPLDFGLREWAESQTFLRSPKAVLGAGSTSPKNQPVPQSSNVDGASEIRKALLKG